MNNQHTLLSNIHVMGFNVYLLSLIFWFFCGKLLNNKKGV